MTDQLTSNPSTDFEQRYNDLLRQQAYGVDWIKWKWLARDLLTAFQERTADETSECPYESEDGDTLTYETGCGNVFRLDPMLELYEFCPYCGKRVAQKSNAVRDSIAPNKQCPKCLGFFWLDKFDGHDCRPLKAIAPLCLHEAGLECVCRKCGQTVNYGVMTSLGK